MSEYRVKELMVPLSEYATVTEDATLYDAVLALEKAQENFEDRHTRYRHRAILMLDKSGQVVGKLSQLDVLKALEPKYQDMIQGEGSQRFGFTKKFMQSMLEDYSEAATLEIAIHQLIMGQHQSLLVTRDAEIVGILRLTDVFAAVFHKMKECFA